MAAKILMNRQRIGMRCLTLCVAFGLSLGSLLVQAQVPTADQIELLRSLSPEDRDALLKQLGIGDSSLGDAAANNSDGRGNGERASGARSSAAFAAQLAAVDSDRKSVV